jgi:DNA-binding CsgD family transcriptional regulator
MNSAMSAPLPDQSSSAVSADDRPIDSQLGLLRFPLRWSDTAIIAFVPKDRFPVSGPVLDGLKTVYPVLQRAIDALARLCMERSLGIMDGRRRPGVASAIIGNRTHLLYMEPNFAAGIEPWFDVDRNHLEARNAELAAHVRSAVEAVCTTGKSDVFRLADAASRVAAALYLTPLHRATAELRPRAGLATLVSASLLDGPDPPTLERVFELTHMEALVAARIINGKTVEDIARDQRRSVLTIRNQLKSVFSKIGCQRQIELLRIVFALVPPTVY